MARRRPPDRPADAGDPGSRFPADLLYRAARLYYVDDATQAEIADTLGTSRPTVSRLLADARATGIVHIEVRRPESLDTAQLADRLAAAIGLRRAWVAPGSSDGALGEVLAPALSDALLAADLQPGDALLISSGKSVLGVSRRPLPALPGVLLAPTVGGRDEPEEHYQTNELTLRMAEAVAGTPVLLHAPAMPAPELHGPLLRDRSVHRVTRLWATAHAAVLGIGSPPDGRRSMPSIWPADLDRYGSVAADICGRPFDADGTPLEFPGVERMVAMTLEDLRRIPHAIGVAGGADKVEAIRAAARAGYITELVTDTPTARSLIDATGATGPSAPR